MPWPGWCRLVLHGSAWSWLASLLGVVAPRMASRLSPNIWAKWFDPLDLPLAVTGMLVTMMVMIAMPHIVAARHSQTVLSTSFRPGYWRILAVTFVLGVVGAGAIVWMGVRLTDWLYWRW